jgi:AraC-like DNA-binding protein
MPAVINVGLKVEERGELEKLARSNRRSVREKTRARILLLSDANREEGALRVEEICGRLRVSPPTVVRVKKAFLGRGVKSVFHKEQSKRKARVLDGEAEAFLIATVCGAAPEGRKRWTLELLKDKLIAAGYVDEVAKETVRQVLKKTNLNLG